MNSPIHLNLESADNTQRQLTVVANMPQDGERSLTLRMESAGKTQDCVVLSVEEARALSLAIISVVNKHERHAHIGRNQGVAVHPATR